MITPEQLYEEIELGITPLFMGMPHGADLCYEVLGKIEEILNTEPEKPIVNVCAICEREMDTAHTEPEDENQIALRKIKEWVNEQPNAEQVLDVVDRIINWLQQDGEK